MSAGRRGAAPRRRVPVTTAVLIALAALAFGAALGYVGRGGSPDPRPATMEVPLPVVTVTAPVAPSPAPEPSTSPQAADPG